MADSHPGLGPADPTKNKSRPQPHSEEFRKSPLWVSNPVALVEMAHDAIVVRDPASVIQYWNPGASDLYGWSAEEAIGSVSHELLETRFLSSQQDVEWSLMNLGHWEGELIHRRKDGSEIRVTSRQALRRDEEGNPVFILEINRDVTEEHRKTAYLKLVQSVATCASEARNIHEALELCLESVCTYTDWCVARVYLQNTTDSDEFDAKDTWFISEPQRFALFREFAERNPLALETGLAGRVLQSARPVWISDIQQDAYFQASPAACSSGLKSALGLPVLVGTTVVSVIELFSENQMEVDEAFLDVMTNVARQLGRVFERVYAEEAHRRLSVTVLRSQDEERRRIARELHDSAGQYLAAVGMCLDVSRQNLAQNPDLAVQKLNEADEITKRCAAEIRTISHLLHPPLIEELGLASAARWCVEGFAERSGIQVETQIADDLGRLGSDVEIVLFRVLQESLTNIHRHSGSKTATVSIGIDNDRAWLEVSDRGKGIPRARFALSAQGVGINGMRERVKDLGGTLELKSGKTGTSVKALVPLKSGAARTASSD